MLANMPTEDTNSRASTDTTESRRSRFIVEDISTLSPPSIALASQHSASPSAPIISSLSHENSAEMTLSEQIVFLHNQLQQLQQEMQALRIENNILRDRLKDDGLHIPGLPSQ
jgi:hypothetical protein